MKRFLAGAAACLCVFSVMFMAFGLADYFLYYPMRYPDGEWAHQARAGAEERWVRSADGTRLNCAWYPLQQAQFVTLFLHGNAGNVTHRVDHARSVRAAGSAILVLDYRGYGKSDGRPGKRDSMRTPKRLTRNCAGSAMSPTKSFCMANR